MRKANKLMVSLAIFLLMAVGALAIAVPTPISGKLIGENVGFKEVQVTNLATGTSMKTITTADGQWLVDWANSKDQSIAKYTGLKIEVLGCEAAECIKAVVYSGEPNLYIEMRVPKLCPECKECVQETDWMKIGAGAIMALIVSLVAFMGGGLKIYKNRVGGVTVQHKHRGIRGYHDANIKHSKEEYSHVRWKDDPMKCISDVKKIEEQGGL